MSKRNAQVESTEGSSADGPIGTLWEEHDLIGRMVVVIEKLIERLEAGRDVSRTELAIVADFVRLYIERCHHAKEERCLFPALARHLARKEGQTLKALVVEHRAEATLLKQMARVVRSYEATGDRTALARVLRRLVALYPKHFEQEQAMFALARKRLSSTERAELEVQFKAIEEGLGSDLLSQTQTSATALSAALLRA